MKLRIILLLWFIALAGVIATKQTFTGTANAGGSDLKWNTADDDMAGWSKASKMAVKMMKKKYGEPTEKTAHMMMWKDNGPWKKTVVYAKEVKHDFPMPHTDVMEQFVEYKVPADKFDDLAMFDGSVVCNRTAGKMSARCDKEEANMLALNLANDIVNGKKDVKSARDYYAKTIKELINGGKPEYTQKLLFDATSMNAGFADERSSIITDEDMKKAAKMMEDMEKEMQMQDTGMEPKSND